MAGSHYSLETLLHVCAASHLALASASLTAGSSLFSQQTPNLTFMNLSGVESLELVLDHLQPYLLILLT
jgi:hypothetical protein